MFLVRKCKDVILSAVFLKQRHLLLSYMWVQISRTEQKDTGQCDLLSESCSLTVMGLGTAVTTIPMVCWGDAEVGLPQDTLSSALLVCPSPGGGEYSFCSCCCCFLWIFLWSCCFASTEGDDRFETWGWKEWASAVGTKADTVCGVFTSEDRTIWTFSICAAAEHDGTATEYNIKLYYLCISHIGHFIVLLSTFCC